MAWVNIKNGRYYCRSRRGNGRVANEHLGGGEFGEMMAGLDRVERRERRIEAGFAQAHRDVYGYSVQDVFGIDEFLGNLFTVLARINKFAVSAFGVPSRVSGRVAPRDCPAPQPASQAA